MTDWTEALDIRPGVTAVIGSGGKTTLLRRLGEVLHGTVILCTTTRIWPFPALPLCTIDSETALADALAIHRLVCVGTVVPETGKLSASGIPMDRLATLAQYVLVEADGAAGRPLKSHASWEPVIPPEAGQTICVVGLSGLGQPIAEAVHRPERFAVLTGVTVNTCVTVRTLATVLNREALADRYLLNQADDAVICQQGIALAELLHCPTVVGSLKYGEAALCEY